MSQESVLRKSLAWIVKEVRSSLGNGSNRGDIGGRQVGIEEDDSIGRYRQPEGKGVRFTVNQLRQLWSRAMGWDTALGYCTGFIRSHAHPLRPTSKPAGR